LKPEKQREERLKGYKIVEKSYEMVKAVDSKHA
jgi:hypothetical protein